MSEMQTKFTNGTLEIVLDGRLDAVVAPQLADILKAYVGKEINKVVFIANKLTFISSAGLRVIVFAKQKLGAAVEVILVSPPQEVIDVIQMTGFEGFLTVVTTYP